MCLLVFKFFVCLGFLCFVRREEEKEWGRQMGIGKSGMKKCQWSSTHHNICKNFLKQNFNTNDLKWISDLAHKLVLPVAKGQLSCLQLLLSQDHPNRKESEEILSAPGAPWHIHIYITLRGAAKGLLLPTNENPPTSTVGTTATQTCQNCRINMQPKQSLSATPQKWGNT